MLHGKETPLDIATELNQYFSSIGINLASNIRPSQLDLSYNAKSNIPWFNLQPISPQEVLELMMSISDSKATGDDSVPIRLTKMCSIVTSYTICHIVNLSIEHNIIPHEWKGTVIMPLFKDGDRTLACKYRPISILPAISKIMDRTIHNQLYSHITENNLLSSAQFGYTKNHSTSTLDTAKTRNA